ncbi:MAG: hypothetical protein AB4041_05595 [Microcystaceae cyanobacterium]
MRRWIHDHLIQCINLGFNSKEIDLVNGFYQAIQHSSQKFQGVTSQDLTQEALQFKKNEIYNRLSNSLTTDKWKIQFRGRDILKRFVSESPMGIKYENFRNLIISRMKDKEYQPQGIKDIIDKILKSDS